jgi:multimeric flavodoxin WrbA
VAYGDWRDYVSLDDARQAHARNIEACRKAVADFQAQGPIKCLVVHSSGRSSAASSAREQSNSQMLLRHALAAVRPEDFPEGVEVEEVALRDYKIEPCDACYSTSSALCGFPCDSFPLDPMQQLYPKVLRSDVLLVSAPTNQAAMSSRLKLFVDRLISLDGGYFVDADQFGLKDAAWRERMIALATTRPVPYDQRMHSKVAAFFITNKDDRDTGHVDDNGRVVQSYVLGVAESLYRGFYNFGFAFPDPFYVAYRAVPQDMIARVELEEEMVEDPTCLRYCSKRCQSRWHALKRGTVWDQHGHGCMCAACFT